MDQSLLNFIQSGRAANIPDIQIKASLQQSRWSEQEIDQALSQQPVVNFPQATTPPAPTTTSKITSSTTMWDAFEHVLLFISLYILAISIGLMLHSFIDKFVPGVQSSDYPYISAVNNTFQKTLVRGYLASLIVTYPLFSLFFISVTKRTIANPSLRSLGARKFLIYLTLVITFIILIANIIGIIFSFLNGNVTLNFVLHFLVYVGISGFIFGYYLLQVKEDRKIHA